MKLKIGSRVVDDVNILDLSGEMILGEECRTLRKTLKDLIETNHQKILLNMEDVTRIDTTGLGVLVSTFGDMNNRQGNMKLLNLTHRMHTILVITKLITIFEVFDNQEAAVKSFQ
jgi:anti-sigma B factor antagonist